LISNIPGLGTGALVDMASLYSNGMLGRSD
jgi:hypothetical protein